MNKISIHVFIHVEFEGLGCIENWINKHNHSVSYTNFYESYTLPNPADIDWLIVMGGPMGVYDTSIYPWLTEEKAFIQQMIEMNKTVIGICLGSQLIAEVLGSKIFPNKQKEIGWFNIQVTENGKYHALLKGFESSFPVFHWHGDTYNLPVGSTHLFSTETCTNQAFIYKSNVLGLQFHLEVTTATMTEMINNGVHELIEDTTIQSETDILSQLHFIESNNLKMNNILDYFQNLKV